MSNNGTMTFSLKIYSKIISTTKKSQLPQFLRLNSNNFLCVVKNRGRMEGKILSQTCRESQEVVVEEIRSKINN